MSGFQLEIQLIAVLTAIACALPGVFLVLRRTAMLSDAISHTVLLGIVIGFFLVQDLTSPFLILGAAAIGVVTVSLVSALERTRLVKEDAAIGLVFPALFSLAVILISRFAGDVHLDTDAVLIGDLAFVPFDRIYLGGIDFGPRGLYLMGGILLINLLFILVFFKELKLSTFDAGLAAALGFAPGLIHYGLMSLVSLTVVGAFDIVGSVLVVALMIAPAASAYLLTDRLTRMIALSVLIGAFNAIIGYWLAHWLDASIAGSIAALCGISFALVFTFSPERGLVAVARRQARQRWEFAVTMLMIHLYQHEGGSEAEQETQVAHLREHLRWQDRFAEGVVHRAISARLAIRNDGRLALTSEGRDRARQALTAS